MTSTTHAPTHHGAGHGDTPRRRGYLMRPGWVRAAWVTPAFFLIGMYIVVALRWLAGWDPIYDWEIIVLIAGMVTAPIGFLLGLGTFDYWLYWVSGRATLVDDHANHGAYRWTDYFKVNTDHKVIGVQYLVTTVFFFVVGGFLAMLFRAELAQPGMQFFDTQTFNGLVSAHATLMIFVFIIPAFAGLANFAVPLMLGAPDMAFPRLNALSFWMLPVAGTLFLASFLAPGGAFATGWTSYAPLASEQPFGQVFFNMGVQWAGASSIATALNFLVTIITMRAPGMTFWRMPLLVWANFTTSLLVVIATPFIAGSQFFVMFDRVMHTSFFTPDNGGYVLGYQHIFWFYSHPAVYIMVLPGFGIISEVISVFSRKPIFGYRLMAVSLIGILVLAFSVWAHHMFVAGMADWLRIPMMITTLLIAVPTGIKVFSWLATLWEGKLHLNTPMLFALGFISTFVIGGLSGVYLAAVPIDIHASDTYFIVAHIHYVLFGGSVFTIFAGIYYWFPKMTGRMFNERLGKLHFWLTFVAFNATFFPMHWVGLDGMPRRVADYAGTVRGDQHGDLDLFVHPRRLRGGVRLQHDHELGARPDRRVEPVEGDDDRVAGLLAAPGLQLRRDPAGRRQPIRVRRPRREARRPQGRRAPGDVRMSEQLGEQEDVKHVLVVANETLAADELVDAVRRRAAEGPIRAVVVAPVNEPRSGYVVYRNSRRASAGRRLDRMVAALRAAGIPAHGDVFEGGPVTAVEDVLAQEPIDELIVSTHPEQTSGWLRRRNVLDELRRLAGDRPLTHVVSDVAARTGQANVLVVANETVLGEPLLSRIRQRAAESPAAFLLVCPQSDPGQVEHPDAERRLRAALATLRDEGIEAHGQVAHPDPYTAAMQVIEDERVDEVIVSTFAGERSGWLRRDVVERLRKDAGVPVEHVVADEPVAVGATR